MKKIKYILFAAIIMLSFNLMVDAKVCTYKIDGNFQYDIDKGKQTTPVSDIYDKLPFYTNYLLSNNGNEMVDPSKYTDNLTKLYSEWVKTAINHWIYDLKLDNNVIKSTFTILNTAIDGRIIDIDLGKVKSNEKKVGSNTLNYFVQLYVDPTTKLVCDKLPGCNVKGKTDFWYNVIQQKEEDIKIKNVTELFIQKISNSDECPDVIVYGENDKLLDAFYTDNYTNFEESISLNSSYINSPFALGFLKQNKNNMNNMNNIEYYSGKTCILSGKYRANMTMKTNNDISKIVNKYNMLGLDIKSLNDEKYDLDSDESLQQLVNKYGDKLTDMVLRNYLFSDVTKDRDDLQAFASDTSKCISDYYERIAKSDGELKDFDKWYSKYDSENLERYSLALSHFLDAVIKYKENLSENDMNKLLVNNEIKKCGNDISCQCGAIIFYSNEEKYTSGKEYVNNHCQGIEDTIAEEQCKLGYAQKYYNDNKTSPNSCNLNEVNEKIEEAKEVSLKMVKSIFYEYGGIDINGTTTKGLCTILYDKENGLGDYIGGGLNLIRIVGPILVIVLTGLDAMKSIASQKEEEIRKFWDHIKIRLICLALLFLVPTIVNFLLDLVIKEGLCQIK